MSWDAGAGGVAAGRVGVALAVEGRLAGGAVSEQTRLGIIDAAVLEALHRIEARHHRP